MLHIAVINADLTEGGAQKFRRQLPLGSIDTDTDVGAELPERLGVAADIASRISKLMKAAQSSPTATRNVGASARSDGGPTELLIDVAIGGALTVLKYGQLDFTRDLAPEVNMRTSAQQQFAQQLREILALSAANPGMQIQTGLVFHSDRGGQ